MKLMMDSLGCDKNRVDSEEMLSCLAKAGMEFTDDPDEAEICVVNTCCFIDSAKEESIAAILENAKLKETGKLKALIVAGCMAERYRDEIKAELPEVDAMIGTGNPKEILKAVKNVLGGDFPKVNEDVSPDNGLSRPYEAEKSEAEPYPARIITTGGLYEYLKIAEGCDKNCTYCVIPKLRGHYRSVPMEKLINEAKAFAAQGVKELILIAQETTIYGVDIYGHKSLHILLKELCNIPDIKWIRLMYCYPEEIYPELIETMASESKICHYIDMPIQHINDKILKKMNRRTTGDEIRTIIDSLRKKIPDIAIRTTLLTGFPGETDEMHKELLEFIKEQRFERLGVFEYSREEGTPAAKMPEQVSTSKKKKRRDELMRAQQEVSEDYGRSRVGTVQDVLIEGNMPEDDAAMGRTYADAPDVDGLVFVENCDYAMTGDLIKVKITSSDTYDLIGEPAERGE